MEWGQMAGFAEAMLAMFVGIIVWVIVVIWICSYIAKRLWSYSNEKWYGFIGKTFLVLSPFLFSYLLAVAIFPNTLLPTFIKMTHATFLINALTYENEKNRLYSYFAIKGQDSQYCDRMNAPVYVVECYTHSDKKMQAFRAQWTSDYIAMARYKNDIWWCDKIEYNQDQKMICYEIMNKSLNKTEKECDSYAQYKNNFKWNYPEIKQLSCVTNQLSKKAESISSEDIIDCNALQSQYKDNVNIAGNTLFIKRCEGLAAMQQAIKQDNIDICNSILENNMYVANANPNNDYMKCIGKFAGNPIWKERCDEYKRRKFDNYYLDMAHCQ